MHVKRLSAGYTNHGDQRCNEVKEREGWRRGSGRDGGRVREKREEGKEGSKSETAREGEWKDRKERARRGRSERKVTRERAKKEGESGGGSGRKVAWGGFWLAGWVREDRLLALPPA